MHKDTFIAVNGCASSLRSTDLLTVCLLLATCYSLMFTPVRVSLVPLRSFPNNYWGWGGEDDALGFRMKANGVTVVSAPPAADNKIRDLEEEIKGTLDFSCWCTPPCVDVGHLRSLFRAVI